MSTKGFNQSILKGGLTRDPDVRYTTNGTAFLNFTLACGYQVNKNGQWEDAVDYVSCRAWGNRAEAIGKYCQKGSQLFIEGKFRTDRYEGKDGKTQYATYVLVQDVQFCGGKRRDGGQDSVPPIETGDPIDISEDFSGIPF